MSLRVGIQAGLRVGLNAEQPHFIAPYLRTAEQVGDLLGITPANLWAFDEKAGNADDAAGTVDLAPTLVTQGETTAWPKLAVRFDDATAGRMEAALAADLNHGLDSFALLSVWTMPAAIPAGVRNLLSKSRAATPFTPEWRHRLLSTTGNLSWVLQDTSTTITISIAANHAGQGTIPIWCAVDRTANLGYLASPLGSSSASIAALATLSNDSTFRFGRLRSASDAVGARLLWAAHFTGAAAERNGIDLVATMRKELW